MPGTEWALNNFLLSEQLITLCGRSKIYWKILKLGVTQTLYLPSKLILGRLQDVSDLRKQT